MSLQKITLNPALVSVGSPWIQAQDSVFKPPNAFQAVGMMPVQLPDDSTIKSLRATGRLESGQLTIALLREPVKVVSNEELVVAINASPSVGDFDQTVQAPNTPVAEVDNGDFRYFLVASAVVNIPTNVQIVLYSFQIACQG